VRLPARAIALAFVLALAYAIAGSAGMTARADTEHSDIYVLGLFAAGTHRIPTAQDPYSFALDPTWSPDGSRVAFTYGVCDDCPGSIVTVAENGRHRREFTDAVGSRPAWSPDGRTIAFVTTTQAIATIDRVTGRISPLITAGRHPVDYPAWSPDGARLAFSRQVTPKNWDIFVYAPSTGHTVRLVGSARSDIEPAWSRDGKWIAYVAQLPSLRFAIRVIRPNGTGAHTVAKVSGSAEDPSWSPNGRSLSYVAVRPGKPESLWVVGINGHLARRLTKPDLTVTSATWAPKGDRIVFSARDTANTG
jgi:TolB protein